MTDDKPAQTLFPLWPIGHAVRRDGDGFFRCACGSQASDPSMSHGPLPAEVATRFGIAPSGDRERYQMREAIARVVCDARMKCGWPDNERLPRGFIDATDEQIADALLQAYPALSGAAASAPTEAEHRG